MAFASAQAAGHVQIFWSEPAHYISPELTPEEFGRARTALTSQFETLGGQYLTDNQELSIEVVELSLAGRLLPAGLHDNIRILSDRGDWPSITLRYDLRQNGQSILSGQEKIADLDYQRGPEVLSSEPFRYEKKLVRNWFRRVFPLLPAA